jgi:hypothetical protein
LGFVGSFGAAAFPDGIYNTRAEKNREEKLNSPPGLTFGFWLRKVSEP